MFLDESNILAIEASLFAAFLSAVGLLSMAAFGDLGRRYSPYISAFAVGALITVTLFHLLPEGYHYSSRILQWVTFGFFFFLGFGLLLRIFTSGQNLNTDLAFAFTSVLALATHSFLDGVLYATAFHGSGSSGWLSVIGLLVHELPEGVIIYYLLRETSMSTFLAIILAFIAACVSTVLGTFTALTTFNMTETSIAMMMGITAGAFIYIMTFHLGPHAVATPNRRGYLAASLGVVTMILAIILEHH